MQDYDDHGLSRLRKYGFGASGHVLYSIARSKVEESTVHMLQRSWGQAVHERKLLDMLTVLSKVRKIQLDYDVHTPKIQLIGAYFKTCT